MTCIAWDGETLAADRMVVHSGSVHSTTKIWRINGELFAVAGNFSIGVDRIEWVKAGMNPDTYPRSTCDEEWGQLLRITSDKRVLLYTVTGRPMHFEVDRYAIGSGADFALAAMYLGNSAAKAVEVASELCSDCGMGVDSLMLDKSHFASEPKTIPDGTLWLLIGRD